MKSFTTKNVDVNGTFLQGHCTTTRAQIEEVLGAPAFESSDSYEKVTTEWTIKFSDKSVATIYDWKRYEQGSPEMNENYSWHIGGSNPDVLPKISEILGVSVYPYNL